MMSSFLPKSLLKIEDGGLLRWEEEEEEENLNGGWEGRGEKLLGDA